MRFVSHLPANLPIYLTAPQLANVLGVSTSSVRLYVKRGILPPPVRLTPRVHLYQTREVRSWIEKWAPESLRERLEKAQQEGNGRPEPEGDSPSYAI